MVADNPRHPPPPPDIQRRSTFVMPLEILAQIGVHGGNSTSLLFAFKAGTQPGKGEDFWIELGPLGWVRLKLLAVIRGVATYEAVEWRSADSVAPPQALSWSASSAPPRGGLELA